MNKACIFLILFLYGMVSLTVGQSKKKETTGRPCASYDQTRDISGMKEILLADGTYASNLRIAYAQCINRGIGKIVVTGSKEDIEYVLENTVLLDVNFVNVDDYENGVRFGDEISFTNLVGQPSDKWAAFRFNGIDYIYAKGSCMNAQRPKKAGIFIKEKPPVETKEEYHSKPAEDNSNWSYQQSHRDVSQDFTNKTTVKQKTWAGKNWGLIAGWVGTTIVNTLLVGDHYNWWRPSSKGETFVPGGFTPITD